MEKIYENTKELLSYQTVPLRMSCGKHNECLVQRWRRKENFVHVCAKSLQGCLTLCDPVGCGPPGSSVHGILQASILGWAAMPSSRGPSPPRDRTRVSSVSCIGRQVLHHEGHRGSPNFIPRCTEIKSDVLVMCGFADHRAVSVWVRPMVWKMPRPGRGSHQRLAFLQRLFSDYSLLGISGTVSLEDNRVKRCRVLGRDLKGWCQHCGHSSDWRETGGWHWHQRKSQR